MRIFTSLFFLAFISVNVMAQNLELGSDLMYAKPTGSMSRNIDNAFGITFHGAKKFSSPFSLGMELGLASYGSVSGMQQYTFDDGSVTETNVVVSNNITNTVLTGKYFFRNGKNINPYLSGKAGWSWYRTVLSIEDPEDEFSCHPIESDVLAKDNTYLVSGGAGVRMDFNTIFKNIEPQRFYFDFNVHRTQGGTVRYMNADKDPSQPMPESDVVAKFINTQTQVIHEHHVGYVYSSMVSMMEYKIGVIFTLNQN